METAKLFKNGRSQAVRLPAELCVDAEEVRIRRDPDTAEVIPSPLNLSFQGWVEIRHRPLPKIPPEDLDALDGLRDRPLPSPPQATTPCPAPPYLRRNTIAISQKLISNRLDVRTNRTRRIFWLIPYKQLG